MLNTNVTNIANVKKTDNTNMKNGGLDRGAHFINFPNETT